MGNKSKRGRWALRKTDAHGTKIYAWAPKGGNRKKRKAACRRNTRQTAGM